MTNASKPSPGVTPGPSPVPPPPTWPTARSGWIALAAAAVGLGSWIVLTVAATLFFGVFVIGEGLGGA